jgi:hypothetical protein
MHGSPHHRISEPKVILLAAGMVLIGVLCVVAIADTDAVWLVLVAALAIASVALAIIIDLRGIISDTGGDDATEATAAAAVAPDRAVVMCTASMTAEQVLEALETTDADKRSIMFVAPEGLGTGGLMVNELDYERALRAETATVAALRRAGINAAGHVGDRNPEHAIVDALALFPAANVVIVARGAESAIYRQHVDVDALRRRTGADVRVLEDIGA